MIRCLAERDAITLVKTERELTINSCLQGQQNAVLVRELGDATMVKAYTGILLMASEFFNTTKGISEIQAIQTASLIIESYPMETIEDFILCLKSAKMGLYGSVYNRLDGQIVFEWFRQHLDEKAQRREELKRNEKIDLQEKSVTMFGSVMQEVGELADKLSIDKIKKNVIRPTLEADLENFKQDLKTKTNAELVALLDVYRIMTNRQHFGLEGFVEAIEKQIKSGAHEEK